MASRYSREVIKIVVAQMCQTIGWHAVQSTPLEFLTDVLQKYLQELGENSHRYAEQFGHTMPTLDDVGFAFRDMGINISELQEYVEYVASVPCQRDVPKYPIERENHLNLLKPGSREVVTRHVHIHEHLPAMHPQLEDDDYGKRLALTVDTAATSERSSSPPLSSPKTSLFKRPGDPVSFESPQLKRVRLIMEEEGRPLREISSVMMTTSGFLSPAREGKLPEARTPTPTSDSLSHSHSRSRSSSPQPSPSSYPTVPPEVKGEKKVKKPSSEGITKSDLENKKESSSEPLLGEDDDSKVKKLVSMKELTKLKALKPGALKMMGQSGSNSHGGKKQMKMKMKMMKKGSAGNANVVNSLSVAVPKVTKVPSSKSPKLEGNNGNSNGAPHKMSSLEKVKSAGIDGKLPSEPDKQKLNILKKISKVKEEKVDHCIGEPSKNSRESSPSNGPGREARWAQINEVIESVIQRSRDDSREAGMTAVPDHPPSDSEKFPYDSPPCTPRTPEIPAVIQKKTVMRKKKKEKFKEKKEKMGSPKQRPVEYVEERVEVMEKPKTPEVEMRHDDAPPPIIPTQAPVFTFFPNFPPAPGLIPPPIGHPGLFTRFPLGKHTGLIPPHPAMPNLPVPVPSPFLIQSRPPGDLNINTTTIGGGNPGFSKLKQPPAHAPSVTTPLSLTPPNSLSTVKIDLTGEKTSTHSKERTKEDRKREHKKEKKEKIKKKKEKIKSKKDKSEKKKEKNEKKEKMKEKKKKREREREKEKEREQQAVADKNDGSCDLPSNVTSVPKITLRLGPASPQAPLHPESSHRKIVIKPVKKPDDPAEEKVGKQPEMDSQPMKRESHPEQSGREQSPELARICALVTRPPKQKSMSISKTPAQSMAPVEPPMASPSTSKPKKQLQQMQSLPQPASTPKVKTKDIHSIKKTIKEIDPVKESAPVPYYFGRQVVAFKADLCLRQCEIQTGRKEPLPVGLRADRPKSGTLSLASSNAGEKRKGSSGVKVDTQGNQVWICPACGRQDDGSPMIGCDGGCDAWYHWVCVGIQVPPESNDWFCKACLAKKDKLGSEKKKKKMRKKKNST